jgi:hypothetical protein
MITLACPIWACNFTKFPCGSGLARDGDVTDNIFVECETVIAGKPGSHRFFGVHQGFGVPEAIG